MLKETFAQAFGSEPAGIARAPGRVNLIGDHTDYCGGYVLPMAIDREMCIAFQPADDDRIELVSADMDERVSVELSALDRDRLPAWARYPLGVAAMLMDDGHSLKGLRAVAQGNVPIGAGLSSSAAFEVAAAMAFCTASGLNINRETLAKICQRAENEFVGMKCGIMDQFVSLTCRAGHAVFLDCTTLEHELVPIDLDAVSVVVCSTNVKHELVGSPYNQRRMECAKALKLLGRHLGAMDSYRDVSIEAFKMYAIDLPEDVRRRARHVVTEDERVLQAVESLGKGDLLAVGALMDASHDSLRDDFEVSCDELDAMVDVARELPGVYGARMTGAGFGGCTVNLVRPDKTDEFVASVAAGYQARTGIEPETYIFRPTDGATVEGEVKS